MEESLNSAAAQHLRLVLKLLQTEWSTFASDLPDQERLAQINRKANEIHRATFPNETVHAYRLFKPGGPLQSPQDIANRFKEVCWPRNGLMKKSVISMIRDLVGKAEQEVAARTENLGGCLNSHPGGTLAPQFFSEDLPGTMIEMMERFEWDRIVPDPSSLAMALTDAVASCLVSKIRDAQSPIADKVEESIGASRFLAYVCGCDTFEGFCRSGSLAVRPYELFLFAAQQGHWQAKLTVSSSDLPEDLRLEEHLSSSLSILFTHQASRTAFEQWINRPSPESHSKSGNYMALPIKASPTRARSPE